MTNRTIALILASIGCGLALFGLANQEAVQHGQFLVLLAIVFCVLPPAPPESK